MPPQSGITSQGKGICLLSLGERSFLTIPGYRQTSQKDAGGSRAISQLKILAELMHRLNYEVSEDEIKRPCDVFNMVGGTGSGGLGNC